MHVVGAGGERGGGRQHELDGGLETVVNVHHGKAGVGAEVALVVAGGQRIVEYLYRVVRGATARMGVVGDDAREPA